MHGGVNGGEGEQLQSSLFRPRRMERMYESRANCSPWPLILYQEWNRIDLESLVEFLNSISIPH